MSAGGVLRALRAAMFAAVCVVLAATGHVLMSGAPVPWWALAAALLAVGGLGWACGAGERRPAAVAGLTVAVQAALHLGFTRAQSAMRAPGTGETSPVRQWADHVLCGADPGSAAAVRAYEVALRAGLLPPAGGTHPGLGSGGPSAPAAHAPPMDPTGSTDAVGSTRSMTSMGHDMAVGMPGTHDGVHGTGAHLMAHATGTASWGMLTAHLVAAALCGLWLALGERAAFALVRACADRAFVPLRLVLAVLLPPEAPAPPRRLRERARRPRPRPHVHAFTTRGPPGATAVL
jgi:hypothetical protein